MVILLELAVYAILALALWFVYQRMAEGGRNGPLAIVFIVAAIAILAVILSGLDWGWIFENWRDLSANGLIGLAILSLIFGYGRLIRIARQRARDREEQ